MPMLTPEARLSPPAKGGPHASQAARSIPNGRPRMLPSRTRSAAILGWLLCSAGVPAAETPSADASLRNWHQWRGPLANGVAPHADPPVSWSEDRNVRWKVALPGHGHASPVVWGDRLFLATAIPVGEARKPVFDRAPGSHDNLPVTHRHQFAVIAIDRTDGQPRWTTVVHETFPHEGGHRTGSLASNSPVTDGSRIYASFGSRGLYCLDWDGNIVWQADLGRMDSLHAHGEGSSPVLHGDSLIVVWDHEGDSFLTALDKRSGRELWKVARDEKTSWATPLVVEHEGRPQVIVSATRRIRGYDLATGDSIWECAGLTDNVVSSPVFGHGLVIAGNSYYRQAMLAIRLAGAKGDVTRTDRVAWRLGRMTPYVSSPLLYGDTLYFLRHNQNILSRLDVVSGEARGEPLRLEGIGDFIFASPVGAAGRLYISGRDGTTVVLSHSDGNPLLSVNRLNDSFSASAAVADRDIYLRGERFLYAIGE